jgi:hypothetical protein
LSLRDSPSPKLPSFLILYPLKNSPMTSDEIRYNATHGAGAVIVGALGAIASFLPQIEQWLRVLVLLLTVVATTISIWKLIRGLRRKDRGRVSMPAWTMMASIVLCIVLAVAFSACTPSPVSLDPPAAATVVEEKEMQTTVRGHDGRLYRLISKARPAEAGQPAQTDLWQPVGAAGSGLPAYSRELKVPGTTGDPVFTRIGNL